VNTNNTKTISPIKIIDRNTIQKKKNCNNSQSSERDTTDVFNYDWNGVVTPKPHKRLNSDKQNPLSKTNRFSTRNKFNVVSQNEDMEMETNEENEIVSKLPPIFIKTKI